MSINQKIREILGLGENASPLIQLRPDLFSAVEKIALRDGLTIGQAANDLIRFALYEDQLAEDSLETWYQLTQREREIAALIWLGLTNPQIAERLSISTNTVKTHIKNILNKFNVRSKKGLQDLLLGLDLSDWAYLGEHTHNSTTNSDSPDGVNP